MAIRAATKSGGNTNKHGDEEEENVVVGVGVVDDVVYVTGDTRVRAPTLL